MTARFFCGLVLALAACHRAPQPVSSTVQVSERERLRDQARLVLETHCGQCHISGYSTALPRALRVFDLLEPEWSSHMTDAQLRNVLFRLGEPNAPTGQPNDVTPAERSAYENFLDAELHERNPPMSHCS